MWNLFSVSKNICFYIYLSVFLPMSLTWLLPSYDNNAIYLGVNPYSSSLRCQWLCIHELQHRRHDLLLPLSTYIVYVTIDCLFPSGWVSGINILYAHLLFELKNMTVRASINKYKTPSSEDLILMMISTSYSLHLQFIPCLGILNGTDLRSRQHPAPSMVGSSMYLMWMYNSGHLMGVGLVSSISVQDGVSSHNLGPILVIAESY